jgi:hypothetical protein
VNCTFQELLAIRHATEMVAVVEDLAAGMLNDNQRAKLGEIRELLAALPPVSIDDELDCIKTALEDIEGG